jgi:hypothetical protein
MALTSSSGNTSIPGRTAFYSGSSVQADRRNYGICDKGFMGKVVKTACEGWDATSAMRKQQIFVEF